MPETVILGTMGLPSALRRAKYRISLGEGSVTLCSAGSIAPTVVKRLLLGDEVGHLLVVVPHSVENSTQELRRDFLRGDWGGGAKESVFSHLERELSCAADQLSNLAGREDASRALVELADRMTVEVTQGIGTFLDLDADPPIYVRFWGKASHTFFAVFNRLSEFSNQFETPLRVVVDATHGWNFFSVLTLLAATAFVRASPGSEIEVGISEPFTVGVTEVCEERGNREDHVRSAGVQGRLPMTLLDVEDISRALKAVEAISKAISLDHRPLEDVLRSGHSWVESVAELLREIGRAVCGLRSGVSVYAYHHLAKLDDMLSRMELTEDISWLEYAEPGVDRLERMVHIKYVHGSPGPEEVVIRAVRDLVGRFGVGRSEGSLRPDSGWRVGKMPLSFLRRLLDFYRKAGLVLQSHTLSAELRHLTEFDAELRATLDVAEGVRTGGIGGEKVSKYLDFLSKRRLNPEAREALRDLPIFSLYCACSSSLGNLLDFCTSAEDLKGRLIQLVREIREGRVPPGCRPEWCRSLMAAWSLRKGSAQESARHLPILLRNLVAHAGLQHFVIREVVAGKGGEGLVLLYDVEFIDAIDRLSEGLCGSI